MNGVEGKNEMCEPADKEGFLVGWEPLAGGWLEVWTAERREQVGRR